jgi:hypothetical protein
LNIKSALCEEPRHTSRGMVTAIMHLLQYCDVSVLEDIQGTYDCVSRSGREVCLAKKFYLEQNVLSRNGL